MAFDDATTLGEDERQVEEGGGQDRVREEIEPREGAVSREDVEGDDREDAQDEARQQERDARLGIRLEEEYDDGQQEVGEARREGDPERHEEIAPREAHGGDDRLDRSATA